jgi:hypothetical protein
MYPWKNLVKIWQIGKVLGQIVKNSSLTSVTSKVGQIKTRVTCDVSLLNVPVSMIDIW